MISTILLAASIAGTFVPDSRAPAKLDVSQKWPWEFCRVMRGKIVPGYWQEGGNSCATLACEISNPNGTKAYLSSGWRSDYVAAMNCVTYGGNVIIHEGTFLGFFNTTSIECVIGDSK